MTYEGMKPMTPDVHAALAEWVKQGGALVFLGDDTDPYNGVRAWWNDSTKGTVYKAPRQHLFERLGLPKDVGEGTYAIGKGSLIYDTSSPAALTRRSDGADHLRAVARRACEAVGLTTMKLTTLCCGAAPTSSPPVSMSLSPMLRVSCVDTFSTCSIRGCRYWNRSSWCLAAVTCCSTSTVLARRVRQSWPRPAKSLGPTLPRTVYSGSMQRGRTGPRPSCGLPSLRCRSLSSSTAPRCIPRLVFGMPRPSPFYSVLITRRPDTDLQFVTDPRTLVLRTSAPAFRLLHPGSLHSSFARMLLFATARTTVSISASPSGKLRDTSLTS